MNQIPIFIINLKKDEHKKNHMIENSKRVGLHFDFIEAIYGKELEQEYVNRICNHAKSKKQIGRELFRGEVGVALSQMHIYRKMIKENIQEAIVFEDDVVINENIHEVISALPSLPQDWELLLLGYHRTFISNSFNRISFRGKKKISDNFKAIRFTDIMDGAFGYIINLKGAKKLLSVLEEGLYMPVDNYTGVDEFVNLYGLSPRCVHVDITLDSNINLERQAYNKPQKHIKREARGRTKLKSFLELLGILKLVQEINYKRFKLQQELKHLPKQFSKLKQYDSEF